ncbi:hypothetical protein [Streptomyces sp. S1D4-23]|uniref:hypothetical protein n=1 Tax=Streptomyces sp. S1D4-23 TaxID=2594463 RepID=UPI0011636D6F|nr:hypothetical protein [Streptomyces sp. S1D4-23]QDO08276.1 hypothetical protein FNV68_20185 [Streptomyces sp. S1D4-23]
MSDQKYAEFLGWRPEHSNCPELDSATKALIDIAPVEWKATMRNIFVARAFKGEANAEASSFRSAGIIELNYGFTMAAMIYTTLFSHFYDSILTAGKEVNFNDDDTETTQMILEEIERAAFEPIDVTDQAVHTWAAERHVRATDALHIDLPRRRKEGDYFNLVNAVEQFVIAHEFCHHMLGHTDSSFRHSRTVRKTVGDWLNRIGIHDVIAKLNEDQKKEVEADVGAFILLSGLFTENASRARTYRAIGGSMVALVALAHVSESWISTGDQETHPDFLTRYEIVFRLVKEITLKMPVGETGDHPMGFMIQFRGFISAVLQTWASRAGADVKMPNFLNIFSWMIDLEVEFREEHRNLSSGVAEAP